MSVSSEQKSDTYQFDVNVDEMLQDKRGHATYEQIKAYVLEHSGLNVNHLYIAQVKREYGIIEQENYNKPKSDDSKQQKCTIKNYRGS